MTRFLLDTHVWIWALEYPERLNARARKQLENAANELYLSPVSIWEAHLMAERGRLRARGTFQQWLNRAWEEISVKEAPINLAVGVEASRLRLQQADVGDLFLAATTAVFDLTLVTADDQLLRHPSLKTLSAGR